MNHKLCSVCLFVCVLSPVCLASLVVYVVSKKTDYAVIAVESREVDALNRPKNDDSCKVVSLGGDTLFFETGNLHIGVTHGKDWHSLETARSAYKAIKNGDPQMLSIEWANRALTWFHDKSAQDLRFEANNGNLVSGGFINANKDGRVSAYSQEVKYNDDERKVFREPHNLIPGQIGISGVAQQLVQEFVDSKSPRAMKAHGNLAPHIIGNALATDIDFVRKAVQFAIDNVTGPDKLVIHGPIEVAVVRLGAGVDWVRRKDECYRQDFPPTSPPKRRP